MCLCRTAVAAKVRLCRYENGAHGGLNITNRAHAIRNRISETCTMGQLCWVASWRRNSFILHLEEANRSSTSNLALYSTPEKLKLYDRHRWQGRVARLFASAPSGSAHLHLRRRLDRWSMITLPGRRVGRAVRVLKVMSQTTSPRVQAAYLRFLCNGVCTKRRLLL